jgi:DNA-binding winged helix-turn-helix (wHTH) protein
MEDIAFGPFVYDFRLQLLFKRGEPVDLGSRAALILERLLQNRGQTFSKAELIGAAWGDQAIEESNLSVQVAALRRALGRDISGREWIATVERVGYRFLPDPPRTARAGDLSLPSIEVALFLAGSGQEAIADLETDEVLAGLSLMSSLRPCRVGETRSPADYRLRGTVTRGGPGAEIRAHLTDGTFDHVLWAETFAVSQPDEITVPRRVAAKVEERVVIAETHRSAVDRPGSTVPYDLYLRARALIRIGRHDENAEAFALLLKALDKEPANPRFLAAAAETLHTRRLVGWPQLTGNDQELRLGFARRAWEASEYDADSLSLAGNAMFTSGEPELGMKLTELAAEMNPCSPSVLGCAGHSHLWVGRLEEARAYYERAIALVPNGISTRFAYSNLASVQNIAQQPEQALQTASRGWAISSGYSGLHWQMMVARLALDRPEEAKHGFNIYRVMHPHATLDNIRISQPHRDTARLEPLLHTLRELGLS